MPCTNGAWGWAGSSSRRTRIGRSRRFWASPRKKSSWCPNISASRSVGQRRRRSSSAPAAPPQSPSIQAPMAAAWACSRSLPLGDEGSVRLAGRGQVGGIGAHQVQVGDQRLGHRRRDVVADELGRQVHDVGVEPHEPVDRPVVALDRVGIARHRVAVGVGGPAGCVVAAHRHPFLGHQPGSTAGPAARFTGRGRRRRRRARRWPPAGRGSSGPATATARSQHLDVGRVDVGEAQQLGRRAAAEQGRAQRHVEVVAPLDDQRRLARRQQRTGVRARARRRGRRGASRSSTSSASTPARHGEAVRARRRSRRPSSGRVWEISARRVVGLIGRSPNSSACSSSSVAVPTMASVTISSSWRRAERERHARRGPRRPRPRAWTCSPAAATTPAARAAAEASSSSIRRASAPTVPQPERVGPVPRRAQVDDAGDRAVRRRARAPSSRPSRGRACTSARSANTADGPPGHERHPDAVGAGDGLVPAPAGDQPDALGRALQVVRRAAATAPARPASVTMASSPASRPTSDELVDAGAARPAGSATSSQRSAISSSRRRARVAVLDVEQVEAPLPGRADRRRRPAVDRSVRTAAARSCSIAVRRSTRSRSTSPPVRRTTNLIATSTGASVGITPPEPILRGRERPARRRRPRRTAAQAVDRRRQLVVRLERRQLGELGLAPVVGRAEQEPRVGGQQHRHVVVGVAAGEHAVAERLERLRRRGASGRASAAGSRRCGRRRRRGCGTGSSAARAGPSAARRTRRTCPTAARPASSPAARRGTRPRRAAAPARR